MVDREKEVVVTEAATGPNDSGASVIDPSAESLPSIDEVAPEADRVDDDGERENEDEDTGDFETE